MSHYSRSNDARMTTRINAATAARAVSAPVCADDDCMQCAMGLYCSNAPKATAKPRVRVCLSWTAAQLEVAMFEAVLSNRANTARAFNASAQAVLDAMRGPAKVHTPKPMGTSKSTLARAARHARNCAAMVRS